MIGYNNFFGEMYAQGATTSTAGKLLIDGNIDLKASSFPRKIREQTHWLNVNTTDVPTIVRTNTNKTIGVSVSTQVETKSKTFNKQAESLIEKHGKKGVGELTGRHHFNKSLRIMSDFDLLDGGFIIRHHYSPIWEIPYKYELVGVDMIDVTKTTHSFEATRTETTINGLVRNKWGQITHLWLYATEEKISSIKVPYDNLTYYSDTWISIDQQTAASKLVSMLKTLDQSLQYGTATLNSAIEAAKAGHYLKSQAYNEVMMVVADTIKANTTGKDAASIAKAIDLVKPIMRQLSNLGIKPHGVTPIASGDEVQFDTKKTDSEYKALNDNNEMKMASSLGYSDIGTYKKASDANYSSIKATIEMDQITADVRFNDLENVVLQEIHTRLIRVGIQQGFIKERVKYWSNPYDYNKFRYLRQNKIDIEPAKNATANKTNIELGIDTEANIVETKYGIKYEDYLDKKHEQDLLRLGYEAKIEKARQDIFEKEGVVLPEDANKEALSNIQSQNKELITLQKRVNLHE